MRGGRDGMDWDVGMGEDGTVSKFVSNVPKPTAFNWSVRYDVMGFEGINHVSPMR
jgi:hypothetical protein